MQWKKVEKKEEKNGEQKLKDEKIEITKKLLKEGMNSEKITLIVGLSKEEIKKIEKLDK